MDWSGSEMASSLKKKKAVKSRCIGIKKPNRNVIDTSQKTQ